MTTPATSEISQPTIDRFSARPRIRSKSISLPARKNSMASPNSASLAGEFGRLAPSRGSTARSARPSTISKTTSGIRTNLASSWPAAGRARRRRAARSASRYSRRPWLTSRAQRRVAAPTVADPRVIMTQPITPDVARLGQCSTSRRAAQAAGRTWMPCAMSGDSSVVVRTVDDDQRLAAHRELQHGTGDHAAAVQPVHHLRLVLHDLDDPADLVPAAAAGGHIGADQVAVGLGDRPDRFAEVVEARGSGCRTARSAGARAARSAAARPARSSRVPSGRPRRARPASPAR